MLHLSHRTGFVFVTGSICVLQLDGLCSSCALLCTCMETFPYMQLQCPSLLWRLLGESYLHVLVEFHCLFKVVRQQIDKSESKIECASRVNDFKICL